MHEHVHDASISLYMVLYCITVASIQCGSDDRAFMIYTILLRYAVCFMYRKVVEPQVRIDHIQYTAVKYNLYLFWMIHQATP